MENIDIVIKKTTEFSATEILEIIQERVKVFVVEQNCPYEEVDEKDFSAIHVLLKKGEDIVAYGRILPPKNTEIITFGRILVVKKYRHLHLGRQLLDIILKEIKGNYPDYPIKIQAQAYLQNFYGSFGFKAISDVYLEDNIPHIDMLLAIK